MGVTARALEYDIAKVKTALIRIRRQATIHEGLHQAVVEDLQWLESFGPISNRPGAKLEQLSALVADGLDDTDLEARVRPAIRALSADQAQALVEEITHLLDLLQQEAQQTTPARQKVVSLVANR